MRSQLRVIQKALRKRESRVSCTGAWLELHEDWGVGRKVGNHLHLTLHDRDLLRQKATEQYGVDPLALDLEKGRVGLSEDTSNEKLSSQRAFGRLLRVAVPGHGVTISPQVDDDGDELFMPTPPGVLLSVEPTQLRLDKGQISRVLVIENGAMIELWWKLVPLLPEPWRQNTLLAYRGHRQDLRSLQEWIASHSEGIKLGFYGDYDPYGVRIGLHCYERLVPPGQFSLIGPADVATIPRAANKPDTFQAHAGALRFLKRRVPAMSGVRPLVDSIDTGAWAVTQEALLAHNIRLAEYPSG